MAHTVTITRTTTASSTSAFFFNTGYCKTWSGLLKLSQLIMGVVGVATISSRFGDQTPGVFFLVIAVTFLIGTAILLFSCLISVSTAAILAKTVYEVVYHSIAFLLYIVASMVLITEVNEFRQYYPTVYTSYFAAAIIGFVTSALYIVSTILAFKTFKNL